MGKKKFTKNQCIEIAEELQLDLEVIGLDQWIQGIHVELEHGKVNAYINITNDDLLMTAKIALAHLIEYPDYYDRLEKMENQAKKYWKNRQKPDIFLS